MAVFNLTNPQWRLLWADGFLHSPHTLWNAFTFQLCPGTPFTWKQDSSWDSSFWNVIFSYVGFLWYFIILSAFDNHFNLFKWSNFTQILASSG